MPPGRRPRYAQLDFVRAAIAYADEHGLDALTLKVLGVSMGAATTAVYRYFPDKRQLIIAMREALLGTVLELPVSHPAGPRDRLMALAVAYRATVREHPCLGQVMMLGATEGDRSGAAADVVAAELAALGLDGPDLARAYQQYESFVIGATTFDFSGAPEHLILRRDRLRRSANAALRHAAGDAARVEVNNEAAFFATLHTLLNAFEDAARQSSVSVHHDEPISGPLPAIG